MVRVCVLGNSHVACIKRAWDAGRDRFAEFDLTFFAARREGVAGFRAKGNLLVPASDKLRDSIRHTSGGHESVDLRLFDHVLIVGLFRVPPTIPECKSLEIAGKIAALQQKETPGHRLVSQIRRVSEAIPVWVMHNPLRAADAAASDRRFAPDTYVHVVRHINDHVMRPHGALMFEQPAETIANTFYTKPEFNTGSRRLDVGKGADRAHQGGDEYHMNAAFGAICLEQNLPMIAAASSRHAAAMQPAS